MKCFSKFPFLFIISCALLIAGCQEDNPVQDTNSSTNQDLAPAPTGQPGVDEAEPIEGQYLVIFHERWQNIRTNEVADQVRAFTNVFLSETGIPADSVIARFKFVLRGFTARIDADKAEALQSNPQVDYVQQDRRFKAVNSTTRKYSQIGSPAITTLFLQVAQTTPWGVTRVRGPLDGTGKKAWILDTGIDLDHDDLNVDTNNSASFIANEPADDLNGHGTHVTGILAAIDNDRDVVGVAAGADVVSVKVLDENNVGSTTSVCNGIDHVVANASTNDVVNMSLGLYDPDNSETAIDNAVTNAADTGFRFAIAAGNTADDANNYSPARVEHSNVWTVSAFRDGDEFAQTFDWNTPNCNPNQDPNVGSNFENPPIEYSGPGEDILSLWNDNGTLTTCGTSMATPHIAGLLLAAPDGIATDGFVSNDSDGDADPIAVAAQMEVEISGPSSLEVNQQGTWTADVTNAPGAVSYQWYYTDNSTSSWIADGTDSDTYSHTFTETSNSSTSHGVKVEVTSGGEDAEDIQYVTVIDDDCDPSTELCEN